MIASRDSDWRSIVLAIGALGAALLAFSAGMLVAVYALLGIGQVGPASVRRSAFDLFVLAAPLLAIGMVFLPAAYYSLRAITGRGVPAAVPRPLKIRQGILLVLLWAAAALGAGRLADQPLGKWITPVLYVVAIAVPVYFFARLAMGGIGAGSRERVWGALAAGIGLGVGPAMIAEMLLGVLALVGLGFYAAAHPELLFTLQRLARELQDQPDIERFLPAVGPWLTSPLALFAALLFFAGLAPVIEETTKSLTAWVIFDRLSSPAQGFAIGAMSGAAFGLVESLLVSANPDSGWTTTLLVRGASTMMHIMAASLTGWGIAAFRANRNLARLLGMYLLAIGLHGLWNASVVAILFGSLRSALAPSSADPVSVLLTYLGAAVLVVLCIAIPLGLFSVNRSFRAASMPATTAPPEVWDTPPMPQPGAEEPQTSRQP